MSILAIVSVSGGKDSTATALLALDALGADRCRFVFADTGHEHPLTYEYIHDYLPVALGKQIETIRADFSPAFPRRREYILTEWPKEGIGQETIDRVLSAMNPTGIPFLDLCILKGRFPSRKAQFCTQDLKRIPLDAYMLDRMSEGYECESWRGIRRDESRQRSTSKPRERVAEGYEIVHPIVEWTAQQTVDFVISRGVLLNPLYTQGMGRVGCFPCINVNKDELLQVAQRFPEHIEKIKEWEALVSKASKRGYASFFVGKREEGEEDADVFERLRVEEMVAWSKTSRGGKQYDMIRAQPPAACTSIYGLCE